MAGLLVCAGMPGASSPCQQTPPLKCRLFWLLLYFMSSSHGNPLKCKFNEASVHWLPMRGVSAAGARLAATAYSLFRILAMDGQAHKRGMD